MKLIPKVYLEACCEFDCDLIYNDIARDYAEKTGIQDGVYEADFRTIPPLRVLKIGNTCVTVGRQDLPRVDRLMMNTEP